MIPENYPYKVGYVWAPPFRFQRITQVLKQAQSGDKLDVDSLQRLQSDVLSLPALRLIALLRTELGKGETGAAAKLLLQWDGELDRDSAAAALYEVWLRVVTTEAIALNVPPTVQSIAEDWDPYQLANFLDAPGRQGRDAQVEMLRKSLDDSWKEMERLQGPDPAKWSWGELHKVRFRHPLDQTPDAAAILDPGPVARPGDEYTVNATGFPAESFDQVSGASYREILDLADWDHSVAVNVPGQSGQPGSPHYSDLLPLWSEGKYFPLVYSREAVEREATDRLVLEP
jgi:penicillin amidase